MHDDFLDHEDTQPRTPIITALLIFPSACDWPMQRADRAQTGRRTALVETTAPAHTGPGALRKLLKCSENWSREYRVYQYCRHDLRSMSVRGLACHSVHIGSSRLSPPSFHHPYLSTCPHLTVWPLDKMQSRGCLHSSGMSSQFSGFPSLLKILTS